MDRRPVPDARALSTEIEAVVAGKQASGGYPRSSLRELRARFATGDADVPPEVLGVVESARPLRSGRAGIGPAIVFAKRVVRRLLSWYVAPIAQDQTRFNLAITGELRRIERRLSRIETPWIPTGAGPEVETRVDALNQALGTLPAGPILAFDDDAVTASRLASVRDGVHVHEAAEATTALTQRSPIDRLETTAPATLAGVILAGLLPRMTAAEQRLVLEAARRALRPGGVIVVDAPDPDEELGNAGAPPDPLLRRPVSPAAARRALEAAGCDAESSRGYPGWYVVAARRRAM